MEDALESYAALGMGLRARLYAEIVRVLSHIEEYPDMYKEVKPRVRRAKLSRFRFCLFYMIDVSAVEILAFHHQAESPKKWPSS